MTALVQWLWQGTVLAVAVAVTLRCVPRANAATRHAIWWLTLAATLALPVAASLPGLPSRLPLTISNAAAEAGPTTARAGGDVTSAWLTVPAAADGLVACGIGIWLGSVVFAVLRLVAGISMVQRLKRQSPLAPACLTGSLPNWQAHQQSSRHLPPARRVELRTSSTISGACALGLTGPPAVVVSGRLLTALKADALDLLVLHELVHLRRFDDWLRVVQSGVLALTGLHPAIRFISGRIDLEREAACDEAVAVASGEPRRYASCLAAAADLIAGSGTPAPLIVPNAVGHGSLVTRVQRLLEPNVCRDASLQAMPIVLSAIVLAGATAAGVTVGDLVAVQSRPTRLDVSTASTAAPLSAGPVELADGLLRLAPGMSGSPRAAARPERASAREGRAVPVAATPTEVTVDNRFDRSGERADSASPGPIGPPAALELAAVPAKVIPFVAAFGAFPGNRVGNRETSGDNGWAATAVSTRRAGIAIGAYFSRSGRAVARQF